MSEPGKQRRGFLASLSEQEAKEFARGLTPRQREAFKTHWRLLALDGQLPPDAGWSSWMIMAGRGFGKTRAGAEWVRAVAESDPTARIALVAASLGDARAVMVEGPSGLLAIARRRHRPRFEPSLRLLRWPSGAEARLFSAAEPETLRGPQFSHAWCDELGKWSMAGDRALSSWDNLLLGLRLGSKPQLLVTTTPRTVPLLRRLAADADMRVSRGRTRDNDHNLAPGFADAMQRRFGQSVLGRQELEGELIDDVEGALWSRALLDRCRLVGEIPDPARVVVAVDPPASATGDACGIVVAELGSDGNAVVRADCTVEKASPETWARAVANAAADWGADRVVVEANQGGAMVASVLRAADIALPVKLVHASRGKAARAEPVVALYENRRVRHAGIFAALEDQLCGLMAGGDYRGPGRSPDRADALVWALSELMLGRHPEPQVRVL